MPSAPHAPRAHYKTTFAVIALGALSYSLLQSLVLPALPEIQRAVHTSTTSVTWLLTAFLLSASVVTPIAGRLGDMFGKHRLLVMVLALTAAGTLLSAVASSIGLLIVGRVVQGAGGAVFPLAFGIIRDEFPRGRVAGGIGMLSAILGVGGGAGIILAGVISDNLSYHWLFWFPLVTTTAAALAAHFFVPESPVRRPGRVNWSGAALLGSGLTCVLVAVSETTVWGWTSGRFLGLLAVGGVLLAGWVRSEVRAREPLVDMRMMRLRGVWTTNLAATLIGFAMFSAFVLLPQFVEAPRSAGYGFGATVTQGGLFLLPSTLAMLVVSPLSGRLAALVGSKAPLVAGAAASTASFVILTLSHAHRLDIYLASLLLGLGIGLAFAAMANLIVDAVPPHQTGVATGMNTIMRSLGGALGGQVTASVVAGTVLARTGLPTEHGYTLAFAICAGGGVASVVAGLLIPGRRRTAQAAAPSPRPAVEAGSASGPR